MVEVMKIMVEEWNSTCLSSCSRGDRPLVELCLKIFHYCKI